MKANETKVESFLSSNKTQFVIPVYQRNYDWSMGQCKQLIDDILEVGSNNNMSAHFIGSIVYVHDDVYTSSHMAELSIIDGQQRLTTLTLIYLGLHHLAKEMKNESLVSEISETYLINKFAPDKEKLKLRPTDRNDKALKYLLRADEDEEFLEFSKLIDNFEYFKTRITEENYQVVLKGLSKLMFVEISLDREKDNPQRIFESLNSTGLELSQADLIRNYILMDLNRNDQLDIYQNYWEVIENLARDESSNISRVSDYIRDYLTLENKKIPNKGKVYIEFKNKYPTTSVNALRENLKSIKNLAKYYHRLINPKHEPDSDIQLALEYISRLEINVAFPFLLQVYSDYGSSKIDKKTFLEVLELIQSFVWRRFIVGLPTNSLNKTFMNLYDKIDPDTYLYSIQKILIQKMGIQRFPKDPEVIEAFKVKDFYNINSKNRIYLLERIENFENTERVVISSNGDITVEHIFPQNPDPRWKIDLGQDEYNLIKENYLNTIGNLTLSGNNGNLGNKPFKKKRDLENKGYKDSRLWMNKYLSTLENWNIEEIEKRFNLIADRFLQIWKYPDIDLNFNIHEEEVNIFDADNPTHKKLDYAIFFDQKIEVGQVTSLYIEVFRKLFEIDPDRFFTSDLGSRISLTKDPKKSKLRTASAINGTYYIESNFDSVGKFERIKYALEVLGFEDELSIKYKS